MEAGFQAGGGKGNHKTGTCSYRFERWTALEFGAKKHHVMPLRRIQDDAGGFFGGLLGSAELNVTHPPLSGGDTPKMVDDRGNNTASRREHGRAHGQLEIEAIT